MRVLPAARHRRMPWRNGGGVTMEVAAFPDGAGLGEFGWRVSMATVAADGPFSLFPGVDRTLAVLSGDGLALDIGGVAHVVTAAAPLAFPADVPTAARLLGGTVTDLNVMTRRGVFAHRLARLDAPAADVAVLVAADEAVVLCDGREVPLGPLDAALPAPGETVAPRHGTVWAVAVYPLGAIP